MQAPVEADARRAGPPAARRQPNRIRLGKREWQDIRRGARTLGDVGTLRAVEIHGVKIFFGWAVSHQTPLEASGDATAAEPEVAQVAAKSQRQGPQQLRPPNARRRRSAKRMQDFLRHKQEVNQQQQEAGATAHDEHPSCERAGEPATATRGNADADTPTPRAAENGGSQAEAAVPCGTARQQAMAGAPAAAPLHALRYSGESSLDEAESTSDDMSDGEDARQARPNGRRPGGTPMVPCKRVPSGSPSPPPAARRDGSCGPGRGPGKATGKGRRGGKHKRRR